MKNWLRALALSLVLVTGISFYVRSDYTLTQGVGTTIFAFTCFTSKVCPAHVLIASDGTTIGNATTPISISVVGTATVSQVGIQTVSVANVNNNGQAAASGSSPVVLANDKNISLTPYPIGSVPYTASNTGTSGVTSATLTGASGVTTYICGFSIRAGANSAAAANSTIIGTTPAALNFVQWTAPTASGLGVTEMIFQPCLPASATNTNIVAQSAAPGAGGIVSVSLWGFKL